MKRLDPVSIYVRSDAVIVTIKEYEGTRGCWIIVHKDSESRRTGAQGAMTIADTIVIDEILD